MGWSFLKLVRMALKIRKIPKKSNNVMNVSITETESNTPFICAV